MIGVLPLAFSAPSPAPSRLPRSAAPTGTLFRIDHPGRPTSYLLGTVHSADPRVLAKLRAIDPLLEHVRTLAVEIELGPGDRAAFLEAAQGEDGRRLADVLDAQARREVHERLDGVMSPALVERLKPWAIFLKLAEDRTGSADTLDARLVDLARRRRLAVLGLELPEEQIAAFDSIPLASQVALVRYVLEHRDALAGDHAAAVQAWLAGDLRRLASVTRAPGERDAAYADHFAALERALVDGRSALFAHRLFGPLRSGRVLIAVGASHLAGERGLIARIEALGYRVRAVE